MLTLGLDTVDAKEGPPPPTTSPPRLRKPLPLTVTSPFPLLPPSSRRGHLTRQSPPAFLPLRPSCSLSGQLDQFAHGYSLHLPHRPQPTELSLICSAPGNASQLTLSFQFYPLGSALVLALPSAYWVVWSLEPWPAPPTFGARKTNKGWCLSGPFRPQSLAHEVLRLTGSRHMQREWPFLGKETQGLLVSLKVLFSKSTEMA